MTRTAETMSIRSAVQRRGTVGERARRARRDEFRQLLADVDIEVPTPSVSAEQALLNYLTDEAKAAKEDEERNSASFKKRFDEMSEQLLAAAIRGDMYQIGPAGSGMVSFDNTEGTRLFEVCLKTMREQGFHQTDFVRPFVEGANLENWGDVDVDTDLVIMRYETHGPVEVDLDAKKLQRLTDAAHESPGVMDRVRTALAESDIVWEMSDPRTGEPVTTLLVNGCYGRWAACISSEEVLKALADALSVVEVSQDCKQEGWWDAARIDRGLPAQLLPMVRNKEPRVICRREDIAAIETWATSLPGWNDDVSTPLVMRDAVPDDILN